MNPLSFTFSVFLPFHFKSGIILFDLRRTILLFRKKRGLKVVLVTNYTMTTF